jgi:hypothetical protein
VLAGTANLDGPGLLLRGHEYQPLPRTFDEGQPRLPHELGESQPLPYQELDALVVGALIRLARLAGSAADALRECPDPAVRRSAAILAARAHPIRAAFDD